MKTLEEKAQAYDKAIERAKIKLDCCDSSSTVTKNTVYWIFPELRESEDKKIREELIHLVKKSHEQGGYALHKWEADRMIDWLEKLDEQSLVDKSELKFNVGEWVVNKFGDIWHIDSFDKKNYQVSDGKGHYNYFPIAKQDEMRHWDIGDAKDGDVLVNGNEIVIFRNNSFNEKDLSGSMFVYCSLRDKIGYWHPIGGINPSNYVPATKEQRAKLFEAMTEADYIFDFEKKELQKIHVIDEKASPTYSEEDEEYNGEDYGIDSLYHAQRILEKTLGQVDGYQSDDGILDHKCAISAVKKLYKNKPKEWSEEDESMYTRTIGILGKCYMGELPTKVEDELKWLKSFRPQKPMKPSDEQMKALKEACDKRWEPDGLDPLYTLYEQLKNLTE